MSKNVCIVPSYLTVLWVTDFNFVFFCVYFPPGSFSFLLFILGIWNFTMMDVSKSGSFFICPFNLHTPVSLELSGIFFDTISLIILFSCFFSLFSGNSVSPVLDQLDGFFILFTSFLFYHSFISISESSSWILNWF